jgi:hypothetical protein
VASVQTVQDNFKTWAEIHQAPLSHFSLIAEFLIGKEPVRDKESRVICEMKQQKYSKNMNKCPQVGKTGVDAVHGSCPQMV